MQRRGEEAKELLNHPLFVEAFSTVESELVDAWRKPDRTPDQLNELWLMNQLLAKVRKKIERAMHDGTGASKELALLIQQAEQRDPASKQSRKGR